MGDGERHPILRALEGRRVVSCTLGDRETIGVMRTRLCCCVSLAAIGLLVAITTAHAQSLRSGEYTARIDGDGKISLDHGRTPIITTSYAGMFGKLPGGSPIYWVEVRRNLHVELSAAGATPPRLVATNTGEKGITLRREVTLVAEGARLAHEITVPAAVAGSIDTGFTLSPELACGTQVTLWEKAGAAARTARLGAGAEALPYQVGFRKAVFDSEWGKLTVEFETGEGLQAQGALLNGARSTRRSGEWVQILPLSAGVAADRPQSVYRSACLVRFEPTPGKPFLSARRNLLYGGDFEGWQNPDLPDGWRRAPGGDAETAAGLAPDPQVKQHGDRSLRWSLPAGSLSHATQWLNYQASSTQDGPYVFSVYLRAEPAGVQVALRCGGKQQQVAATAEWQRFAVSAEIKTGQPLPAISLEKLSAGTLWVDTAQLEVGDQPTPFVPRPPETVFTPPPFPTGLLAADLARVATPRPLVGCGPEFSYYTRETTGRLIYEVNLPDAERAQATLTVALDSPDGRPLLRETLKPPLPVRVVVPLDPATLPPGVSPARAELRAGEKVVGALQHEVVKLAPLAQGAEVKINRLTRVLWRDGQPYLPCGSDASSSTERTLEHIRAQAANGFNHLHLWSGFWEAEKTPHGTLPRLNAAALTQILDTAQAAGMTVTVNLSHWLSINHFHKGRFTNPDVTDEEILRRALEVVRLGQAHPAVLGWHLIDEPDPAYCTPEWIARIYREVKQVDPYHPAEINVGGTAVSMASFLAGSDYMSVDIYPVPSAHVGVIAPHTRFMRLAGEWRPIRWWIQALPYAYEPTAAEETCMAYQALVEGTRFMLFYNHRPTSYAAWAGLGQIAAEMRALLPALAAERQDVAVVAGEDERVIASSHRIATDCWLIAVNRDRQPVAAELTVPAECAGQEAEVVFENRRVHCTGTSLKDDFAPLARHVYRLKPLG